MLQFWLFSIWLSDKHPACIEPLSSHRKYSYSLWRCIFDVRRNCWAFLFASYAFFQNNLLLFLYNFAQHSYSFLFGSHFTIVKSLPCIKSIFLLSSTSCHPVQTPQNFALKLWNTFLQNLNTTTIYILI